MFSVTQTISSLFTSMANIIRNKIGLNISIPTKYFSVAIDGMTSEDLLNKRLNNTITILSEPQTWCISYIRPYAFAQCSSLSQINFPNCTSIGESAFYKCSALNKVVIPKCTTIESSCFYSCTSLTTVICQASVIKSEAFRNCYNLISLYLLNSSMCQIEFPFYSTPISNYSTIAGRYGSIFVPLSLLDIYKTDSAWKQFSNKFYAIEELEENL